MQSILAVNSKPVTVSNCVARMTAVAASQESELISSGT